MTQKRIALLQQFFDPEPGCKGLLFAKQLADSGYKVKVITGFPNYPGGKLYEGYKVKPYAREVHGPVEVIRLPLYPSHSHSRIGRIANYGSFMVSSTIYCLLFLKKVDVLYAYHPPLTTGITAALVRLIRRIPVIYDVQDMWPDTLAVTGMVNNPRVLSIVDWVAKVVYRRVDHIAVLSPGFKRLLEQRGVNKNKMTVIPNWCNEKALETRTRIEVPFAKDGRFKILFAGNMGKAQALEHVLAAAKSLNDMNEELVFIFLGGGLEVSSLKEMSMALELKNTIFLDPVPIEQVGEYLRQADALLVHLKKDDLFKITIPSKIQTYLAIGKPILIGVEGDAAELVAHNEAGVAFEPENHKSLAEATLKLMHMTSTSRNAMGQRGKEYYRNNMSLSSGVSKFDNLFKAHSKKNK